MPNFPFGLLRFSSRVLELTSAALLAITPAASEPLDVSANLGIVSDYRFRGISLSARQPAVQGGVDVGKNGWFGGAWASTIAEYEGADAELDIYGGYAGTAVGLNYTIGAYAYVYPGAREVNYVELQATVERSLGSVTLGGELGYVPPQANVDNASTYVGASAEVPLPIPEVTARLRGGREDGFYSEKWDWSAEIDYTAGLATLSVAYVDSNWGAAHESGRDGQGGLLLTMKLAF